MADSHSRMMFPIFLLGTGLCALLVVGQLVGSADLAESAPQVFGRLDSLGHVDVPAGNFRCDVAVAGNIAVLTTASDGAFIIDVADPTLPRISGQFATGSYTPDVQIDDTLVYLSLGPGAGEFDGSAFVVISIADPREPTMIATYGRPGFRNCQSLFLQDDLLYAGSNDGRHLEIIDVSQPDSPTFVGSWRHPRADEIIGAVIHDIHVRDGIAYLAYWDGGFQVIDVSIPSSPQPLGQIMIPATTCHSVWVDDAGRAFVVDLFPTEPFSAFRVIDVNNPEAPHILSSDSWCGVPLHFMSGRSDGSHCAFVAHHACGVWALHVDAAGAAHPLDSVLYEEDNLGFWGTAHQNGHIYAAHMERGLYVYAFHSASRGDFNGDQRFDVTDIVQLIGHVLRGGPGPELSLGIADWNCDGHRDMLDVTTAIDHIFRAGPTPCTSTP